MPTAVEEMIPDYSVASYVGDLGPESFLQVGREMIDRFRQLCDLQPGESVLEVGCGIGRIAIPLTQYLTEGCYVGFDIVPHGIEWCQKRVTPLYPNFRFFLADVRNDFYHPEGRKRACDYRFPVVEGSFDFAFLTSVFTHMLPKDVEHYVSEIARALDPRTGRVFCTAYIVSDEAKRQLDSGTSVRKFERGDGYWTESKQNPEAAIGYDESYLRDVFERSGLEVTRIVTSGWWAQPTAQDILIARKR